MTIDGIIFDFDGVLIESEYVSTRQISDVLTRLGHPTTVSQAIEQFVGLGGSDFTDAVADWIKGPIPEDFHRLRSAEDERVLAQGIEPVVGAIAFVAALPAALPRAIASSSTVHWIETHLRHIGLLEAFAPHIYSGREHVTRGKPAPDVYLYAAEQLGIDIRRTLIIEDSVVGVKGAVASGAQVAGFAAARHCAPGHEARLLAAGAPLVVHDFAALATLIA